MTTHVDIREITGTEELVGPEDGQVWFSPYSAYHVEDGAEDYLVSTEKLQLRLVDGVVEVDLPVTPINNLMKVQLRGIRGYGQPWYVQIPAGDHSLFDLPHIDPDTLDPEIPPSPAWLAALEAVQDELGDKANTADVYDKTAADARYATTAQGAKADNAATSGELADEASTRETADQTLAQTISDYASTLNTALGLKITAPVAPTDGQLVSWNNTLSAWVAVAPSGGRLLSSAVATSGAVAIPGNGGVGVVTAIPNTSISVTNSAGLNVALRFNATFIQTVAGTGSVYLVIKETTSGANTDRCLNVKNLPGSLLGGMSSVTFGEAAIDIGVVTTTRTFDLKALVYAASGSPAVNILSSTINPSSLKAFST